MLFKCLQSIKVVMVDFNDCNYDYACMCICDCRYYPYTKNQKE